MYTVTLRFRVLIWLLLIISPTPIIVDQFLRVEQTSLPTEYPGIRFRLELLLDEVHFELGDDWKPGKLDSDGVRRGRITVRLQHGSPLAKSAS